MSAASFWLVVALVGLGTQALRVAPFLAHGRVAMPPALERLLRHVPPVVLAALAAPGALYARTEGVYDVAPERLIAALLALLVALTWRNLLATLVAGMAALWVLQAVV